MKVKTYEGADMSEIVAQIKSELGSEAVILHTRRKIKGGLWGFFGQEIIEVLAGIDINVEVPPRRPVEPASAYDPILEQARNQIGANGKSKPVEPEADIPIAQSVPAPARPVEPAGSLIDHVVADDVPEEAVEEPQEVPVAQSRPLAPASRLKTGPETGEIQAATSPGKNAGDVDELRTELRELQQTVKQLVKHVATGSDAPVSHDLDPALSYLLSQDVERDIAEELVSSAGLDDAGSIDKDELIEKLAEELASSAAVTGQIRLSGRQKDDGEQRPKVVAFIGPTGVGKTTTIAKLAARFALGKHKDVALITADFFRIGAVRQLKTYAAITGVPLEVVHNQEELTEALENNSDKDLILVDTAGHSQNNQAAMDELQALFSSGSIDEFHLVLSATAKFGDLLQIYERFGVLPIHAFIFSKLDESTTYGPLISLVRATETPVSYLTNGQRVPEDIMVAKTPRLSRLLLRGGSR